MKDDEDFVVVPIAEARAGDVLVQTFEDKEGNPTGHVGIFTGERDGDDRLIGWQMGVHGPAKWPWGEGGSFPGAETLTLYRPLRGGVTGAAVSTSPSLTVADEAGALSDDDEALLDAVIARGWADATTGELILFVRKIEALCPGVSPAIVAQQVRRIWYRDGNWSLLVAAPDTSASGSSLFTQMAPAAALIEKSRDALLDKGHRKMRSPIGVVDVGHVLAGIDTGYNPKLFVNPELPFEGNPAEGRVAFGMQTQRLSGNDSEKLELLQRASGGDNRDFATWAGDLGQVYAEYVFNYYHEHDHAADLDALMRSKGDPAQLLGDIHGYVVAAIAGESHKTMSVSAKLSLLYEATEKRDYFGLFCRTANQSPQAVHAFVVERSRAFASTWYLNLVFHKYVKSTPADPHAGRLSRLIAKAMSEIKAIPGYAGLAAEVGFAGGPSGLIEEFQKMHRHLEDLPMDRGKLGSVVDTFLAMLRGLAG
jgi:hypothetical protein